MPVRCQYFANNIPIPRQHTANYLPIHSQSIANSLPIESQCSSNPLSIHVNTNPHCCQSSVNLLPIPVNPPPMRHKSSQSTNLTFQCLFVTDPPIKFANLFHFSQSIADPMPIQFLFSANPKPIKYQSSVNSGQSTNQMPILDLSAKFWSVANPPIQYQFYTNSIPSCPSITDPQI